MKDYKLITINHEEEGSLTLTHVGTIYDIFDTYDDYEEHEDYSLFIYHNDKLIYHIAETVLAEYH